LHNGKGHAHSAFRDFGRAIAFSVAEAVADPIESRQSSEFEPPVVVAIPAKAQ
jgi:hypothetical protein